MIDDTGRVLDDDEVRLTTGRGLPIDDFRHALL